MDGPVILRVGPDASPHRERSVARVLFCVFEHVDPVVVRIAVVGAQVDVPFSPDVHDLGVPDMEQPVFRPDAAYGAGGALFQPRRVRTGVQFQIAVRIRDVIIGSLVEIDRGVLVFEDDGVFEGIVFRRLFPRARGAQQQQGGDDPARGPAQRCGMYGSFHGRVGFKVSFSDYKFRK